MKKHRINNIMKYIMKIYLMLHNMHEANLTLCFLCLFSVCFPKMRLVCGSCLLLAWEFRPAEMSRVLIVLPKSWKKIEIVKKDWNPEILRIYVGTYTQIMKQDWNPETRLKSWNKIEILKQDQFRKNKNSYICEVLSRRCTPRPGPIFLHQK